MNYQHSYHAGNFSDVFKHIMLIALLQSIQRKDSPFCYIDTHAGTGYYDLFSKPSKKTKEYEHGIEKIIQHERPPAVVKTFLSIVHQINNELTKSKFSSLRYYPGSPLIARRLIRPHDRIIACELQPEAYQSLRSNFAGDKQVAIHHTDGFLGLKAFLPPQERRGVILIDPPYENPDEFTRIAHSLPTALKRFESGVYAIWYPIKERTQVERFYRTIKENIHQPVLAVEMTIFPDIPQHLNGCGLAIINPPWQFDKSVQEALPWVWSALSLDKQGAYHLQLINQPS